MIYVKFYKIKIGEYHDLAIKKNQFENEKQNYFESKFENTGLFR